MKRLQIQEGTRALALFCLCATALWLPVLRGGQALFYDVLFRLFYANAVFLRESFLNGAFPLWNPHLYSGLPFAANLQSAVYYPFSYLFLFQSFPLAAVLNTWLHTVLAATFAYALARNLDLSWEPSCLAGLVFGCNGYFVYHYAFTAHYQAYVWLPLVLLFLRIGITTRKAAPLAAAALFLALQAFAGHPQFVLYSVVAMGIFAFSLRDGKKAVPARRAAAALALVCALGACIGAIQLLPALRFAAQSSRGAGLGYEWATSYSLSLRDSAIMLFGPLWNRYFTPNSGDPHIAGFYFGLPVLLLGILAFWHPRRKVKGPRPWVWLAVAAAGFLLALGSHSPLYRLLYTVVIPLRWFRFPAQAIYLVCLAAALLAAFGLERSRWSRRGKLLVLLACFADLWLFAQKGIQTIDASFYSARPPAVRFLQEHSGHHRVLVTPRTRSQEQRSGSTRLEAWLRFHDSLYPNLVMAHGLYEAAGREELRYSRYDGILERLYRDPGSPWMNILNIRYLLSYWDMPAGLFPKVHSSRIHIYENPRALPRAYFCPDALNLPAGTTEDYVARHPDHDFRSVVLLEGDNSGHPAPKGLKSDVPVKITDYGPNHAVLRVESPAEGWVVLADAYAPGWKATVNGRPAEILRANAVQRAIRVAKGLSTVRLRYSPGTHTWGGLLSIAGLLFALFLRRRGARK